MKPNSVLNIRELPRKANTKRTLILLPFLLTALLAWLWAAALARADSAIRYVNAAAGSDDSDCTAPSDPCASVGYALTQAAGGDELRLAAGVYTENLTIPFSLTLLGGYDPGSWANRDPGQYLTVLHGAGAITVPWDYAGVHFPSIIQEGGVYKMWYSGVDFEGVSRIGYAASPDGIQWTKSASNPVMDVGAPGEWDEGGVEAPFVMKDGATYKMWFIAGGASGGAWRIGYATSSDGIAWVKHASNPVLALGSDDWNNRHVLHPSVLKDSGVYKMWLYTAGDGGSGLAPYIAYATSPDGISWTWDTDNPLFGRTFEGWMWKPHVLHTGGDYQMWYSLWSGEDRIGYATSPNEENWTKQGVVLSGTPGSWDEGHAASPFVIAASGVYTMWYENFTSIGMVTSTNGITWTKTLSGPVISPGAPAAWGEPVVSILNDSAAVTLDGLTITGGDGFEAGGIHAFGADLTLRNCVVSGNAAYGNTANYWAAGGVLGGNPLTVIDSKIINNQVGGGAGGLRPQELILINSLLADNHGDAGIHINWNASLTNVTLVNNDGGILFNAPVSATLAITNSILYSNSWSLSNDGGSAVTVTYSDIQGGWSGVGNLDANPLFIDAANGDYHLQFGSPAVNAGVTAGAPLTDLDGNPRDAQPDMGAFEAQVKIIFLPLVRR